MIDSHHTSPRRGFTLVELLIVVGILGILSATVVVVLNPAELLKRSRDATRYSDIDTLNKALAVTNVENLPLGTANTIYVSIPDSSATCANLGLPALPTGWTYSCATSANLRNVNGTGWLPVNLTAASTGSPLGSLPVDPSNTTSSAYYYAFSPNGTQWIVKIAQFESTKYTAANANGFSIGNVTLPYMFPTNWVKVPGNSSFGTSDFWVMKYHASCVATAGNTPIVSPATGANTYDNVAQPCTGNYYPASTPTGLAITNLTHDTAKTYCANIGAHLLTNDEYMTIARNAEQVASNWTSGVVGTGALFSGHNDGAPAYFLTADPYGDNGYYGETNVGGNQRRTFTLSNGSIVWDVGSNLYEFVQRSTSNVGDATTTMSVPACSNGVNWYLSCDYGNTTLPYVSAWSADVAQNKVGPSNTSWDSTKGMGQVTTLGTGGNPGKNIFMRGNDYYHSASAGAYSLDLARTTSDMNTWFGFRCAR